MERYTEYHAGVPVIRDKELLPGAMKRLAVLEDHLEEVMEKMCDEYCQYRASALTQGMLDRICGECELAKMFEALK